MKDQIIEGSRVRVYDAWANRPKGTWREGIVLCRYGYVSTAMMRILGWSYETAQYPDCIDVQFPDRISRGHFTEGCRLLQS